MGLADDLDRFKVHQIVHALACQLRDVSSVAVDLSNKEHSGKLLSRSESVLRDSKRELVVRLEMLIRTMSGELAELIPAPASDARLSA